MSSQPRVESALDLLDNLKGVVCEFTLRETKLQQDIRVKLASVRRRRDEALEALNIQLAEDLRQAESTFTDTKSALESRYHRRSSRIISAHKSSKKKRLQGVEDREGSRKHKLQTETLQTKRNHETGLLNAENALSDFKAALATEQASLTALEGDAAGAFKGYKKFVQLLGDPAPAPEPNTAADEHQLLAQLHESVERIAADLRRFRKKLLPALFRYIPVWLVLIACVPAVVPVLQHFGKNGFGYPHAIGTAVGCLVLGFVLHQLGKRQAEPDARKIASAIRQARRLHDVSLEKAEVRHTGELARVEKDFNAMNEWIGQEWTRALEEAEVDRQALPRRMDEKATRTASRNEHQHRWILAHREKEFADATARLNDDAKLKRQELEAVCAEKEAKLNAEHQEQWQVMESEWKSRIQPFYDTVTAANADADRRFPPWDPPLWANWSPPAQFGNAAKFARMDVDVEKLSEGLPKDPRLALPGPGRFSVPLLLSYPAQGSILFETTHSGREEAAAALNNIVLRLLSTAPAGRLSFTLIDPVGLGQSFSGIMHLADHAEHLINGRIWTQPSQIEQRLADLNEHMEKVIQMYLRNEYATIAQYNEQAGNIAEKYHFVVVADFPAGFTDAAAKRLLSIAASGARCGVFTLIHWDRRQPMPQDFVPEELRKSSVCIATRNQEFALAGKFLPGTNLRLDVPPAPEFAIEFIHKVGLRSKDSNRVEVPFEQIAPAENERWSLDTTSELTVPIGRTGATKFQYLAIGKGTRQHALLAGKTGSGKSTLFHVIITNLALWCSPDQVEFYLIDFKKGVEFKCYASNRLPHARVVAIESDREFGLSVLQRLDDELKRRGDMFRALGVQDIAGYKRAGGTEPIPRSLLIIDEFQEFFVEDDKIAQTASLLFDRIVRQGRAFGIHVLLGSQTLGGAYTVARTTLGQMVIRIALQCNEADAYLIMDDNNPAPRLLSRPGEGIYNDTAGTVEGNSPFQVVWLPDQVRDGYLHEVRDRANASGSRFPGPIVFEGNAPTDAGENFELQGRLEAQSIPSRQIPRIWLGAPNSIKGPTEVVFHRQGGNNLLIVGQREEASLAIVAVALVSLAVQFPKAGVRIILCDGSPPATPPREYLDKIVQAIPHPITAARQGDLPEIMKGLDEEMARRAEDPNAGEAPPVFLIIHGLQKFNKLRHEEDFGFSSADADAAPNPAVLLNKLITEGTRLGFHVIATCDTFNNVNRFLSRKALSEFEVRVLFQMSANDSASLIDSPKASTLGLHRALFYNEQEGYLETFRPYALPSADWVAQVSKNLSRLLTESGR